MAARAAADVSWLSQGNPGRDESPGRRLDDEKFWLAVLNDLRRRGVDDVLIACVDGLKGFPEAIEATSRRPGCRYGGLLAGENNTATGVASSVFGHSNTASGHTSSVSGGASNTASGDNSSVNGDILNRAIGRFSSILGGNLVTVSGDAATSP